MTHSTPLGQELMADSTKESYRRTDHHHTLCTSHQVHSSRQMPQNIYDNPEFFNGYITLPRQVHGLDGAPEWPAVRAMLPDLSGKRVVDMGCGFGWFTRWAREHGKAASVLGLDVSENMIGRARKDTNDSAITYQIEDLEVLELPSASFDFAYSCLAFHYIEDFERLVRMVFKALTPGSRFIFQIEHPTWTATPNARWIEHDGRPTWPLNSYFIEGERRSDWFIRGVLKYHRTFSTTVNALITAGFAIERVEEFVPTAEQIAERLAEMPNLAREVERPSFLTVFARR